MTIVRKHLLTADLANGFAEVQRIDLGPAEGVGLHLHKGAVVGYIAAGRIRFEIEGEPVHMLDAGSAFFEPANARIRYFGNASETDPATFIAFYLLEEPDQERITMLKQ